MKKQYDAIVNRLQLRRLRRMVRKIDAFAHECATLSDGALQGKTQHFQTRLRQGETVDDVLYEAFAVMREAHKRVLGLYAHDVQLMGAIVLHQGDVAEMKTGEGKTLTATFPLYLNALTEKGVLLVTPNDYLATRDFETMKPVFEFMGLTVGLVVSDTVATQKKACYQSHIVYTTNSTIGFDYLFDNLVGNPNDRYMRPFHYAIIDEADAVLLDMAQTPLVVSGGQTIQSNFFEVCQLFVTTLEKDVDYRVNQKEQTIWLTKKGIVAAEKFFMLDDLYAYQNHELNRHIQLALRAKLLQQGEDYVIEQGEVKLLDKHTGRILHGVKIQSGLHQAIEVKEHVSLTTPTRVVATITYQNLFRLFPKIAGMTGSGKVAEQEFLETYRLAVVSIPTHLPILRVDHPDRAFQTFQEKMAYIMHSVKQAYHTGRPVLIGVANVEMSELYSQALLKEGIPHNVLNAYNVAHESTIIAAAGQPYAVTIGTAMAGRGTDILLGEGVKEKGGLLVLLTERMNSQRNDLQFKGRAGRQGDPGESVVCISLEDTIVKQAAPKSIQRMLKTKATTGQFDKIVPEHKIQRIVEQCQQRLDDTGMLSRQIAVAFDESLKVQREMVYNKRQVWMNETYDVIAEVDSIVQEVLQKYVAMPRSASEVERFMLDNMSHTFVLPIEELVADKDRLYLVLYQVYLEEMARKQHILQSSLAQQTFYRTVLIKSIDEQWVQQVDLLQQLKVIVSGREQAGKHPIREYNAEALHAFRDMQENIKKIVLKNIMLSDVRLKETTELEQVVDIQFP